MRKSVWIAATAGWLAAVSACTQPAPAPPAASVFDPVATVQDIMLGIIDPAADHLWNSVATIVTKDGIEERMPRTDEDWQAVRHNGIALVEATNLLRMDGRHIAKAGVKSEFPGIELEPEEIEKLYQADRGAWITLSQALHDAGMAAVKAAESRNTEALLGAGEGIDTACENCHKKYWYPEPKK
jgi:hypothetical protein